jgi:dihydroneopterin aldolase
MYQKISKMKILLNDIRLYAYHGVLPQEQLVGGWYRVSVEADTQAEAATQSDRLEDTVNYADMAFAIQEEMKEKSRLLEHVAGRIARRLLNDFPSLNHVKVRVIKENPPISGLDSAGAGIELSMG